MKVESFKATVQETFLEAQGITITVTNWANLEGSNILILNNDLSVRGAISLRNEEADLLLAAMNLSRAN